MKRCILLTLIIFSINTMFAQSTIIGTTTYDVQTNNSSKSRLKVYDDGTMSALWTGSVNDVGGSSASTFSDRGMFFNHNDGTAWGTYPTSRVESLRTGFGELLTVEDHEVTLAHNSADGVNFFMRMFKNDAIGGTTWTELGGSGEVAGLWAFSYCPEGTDDIYVVNADAQVITQLYFSRSDDGGESWTVLNSTLPFLTTSDGLPLISGAAESYQIAVNGSDVYVLFGMPNSDLVLLHSNDYGNDDSWERTDILDFPFDSFAGTVETDIDGDGITDTIDTNDGYHEMLITDDGDVHVFSGYITLYSDGFGIIYNYRKSGIWHWTTGMAGAELINTELDWETPDCIYSPFEGIGADNFIYRLPGICSSPTAAWDPVSGRVYLFYTMAIEYTDIFDDPLNFAAESYRDIFGMYSDDGGVTWTKQNNLTNTAELGEENFFVFACDRVVDGKVHVIWQQDDSPDAFISGDLVHENNIRYQAFEEDDFVAPVATSDFSYTTDLYYVTFTNLSTGATCYNWDFGDGGTSTLADPAHGYVTGGTYTVCLTAVNSYGSVTYCEDINLIESPVADFSFSGDPTVNFTDLSTNAPTSWSWDFDDGGTSTEQNPTHTFADNGLYNVCLTATNGGGSNTVCKNVGINFATAAPIADFTYTLVGFTASFSDLTTNTPTSWSWDFDDGTAVSTEQNPSHTYATTGTYNVCLQASNGGGISTECKELQVGVGIEDISSFISLYPNPAQEFIIIEAGNNISDFTVELYNTIGQKVETEIIVASANRLQMNVKNLSAGNYLIKISNNNFEGKMPVIIE
ncbi:MAG: PKD domain-containing protein [Chitinophagales bacterium]